MKTIILAIVISMEFFSSNVFAHGANADGSADAHAKHVATASKPKQESFGKAGNVKKITRTILIEMSDTMRFTPDVIEVKKGETIKLTLHNNGKILHELVIGSLSQLKKHAEMMKKFPNMQHEEPYMAHVQPGQTGSIVWQFNRVGDFDFACLLPGHYEAGMVGKIKVRAH